MATAGSAVGLGSFWRFPYVVGESGGGAFVLLYLIFTFLIGVPVFIAELIIGRRTQKSAITAYPLLSENSHNWRILGWVNVITCLIILSYYSVVSGWCVSYTLMSLNQFSLGKTPLQIKETFNVLVSAPGINIFWFAIFLLLNVTIVLSGVRKGIEHWSKILMPGLFLILMSLFLYAITLPGFREAVHFIFIPNFAKLNTGAVLNALGMAFFTLSIGLGILVTYGSYMQRDQNIPANACMIASVSIFVSIIAALTIFPIVFTFNLPPSSGPGLVFQTLPVLFSQMPASLFISTIFFSLLVFAALTSTISLLEVLVANMIELFAWTRLKATLIGASLTFLIGIPSALSETTTVFPSWTKIYGKNFFDTMNYITASWSMPIAGLFTILFVGWRMKKVDAYDEFLRGTDQQFLAKPWYLLVKWVAPVTVILIILQEAGIFSLHTQ